MPQMDWISDIEGRRLVKHICRFERFSEDFSLVVQKMGRNVTLKHLKASNRGFYRDYYDDETAAIVREWFCKNIEKFGYYF